MSKKLRIVFMGTPSFAVRILDELNRSRHEIVGVVTVQDKPAGRGQILQQSAVKQYALQHDLELLQPEKLKDPHFIDALKNLQADVFVVVAFRMLPEQVWKMPALGTFNLHASLLPAYRGAAPINWALINGDAFSGVTTFLINEQIDAGSILLQKETVLTPNMTVGELHDTLQELGATLTLETCNLLGEGKLEPQPQIPIEGKRALAPKLFKENTRIDWSKTAAEIHNLIRGLDPYPAAWCQLWSDQKQAWVQFKLFNSEVTELCCTRTDGPEANKAGVLFPCGANSTLLVKEIQMEGKKRMDAKAFMAGNELGQYFLKQVPLQ